MVEQRVIIPLVLLVAGVMCRSGQPNVLLIIVDDLRPALGCYGDALAFTPHIDTIASQGTVFTQAYAQQALCGPSRTSFLTSRRPDTTRLYDVHSYWRHHAGNFTTLPQYFKEQGYHTAAAGKVFHPGIVSNHSDDQPYSWSETPFHPPTQAHKQDPVCLGHDGALHTNIYCPVKVEDQPGGSLPDIETTRFSKAWLQDWAERTAVRSGQRSSRPFFLAVGYHKPHIPLKFPREFLDLFPISSVPLAPNRWLPKGLPPVAWNPWNDLRWREDIAALNVSFPYGPLPDYYARYVRQGYYAATSYTDSLIGDLLATLDHLFPDTIVAFIGDHGWSLGEHQEWSKFSNFEVATRVPFIIRNWRRRRRRRHREEEEEKEERDSTDSFSSSPHTVSSSHPETEHPTDSPSSSHTNNSFPHTYSSFPHTQSFLHVHSSPSHPPPGHKSPRTAGVKGTEYNGLVELVDLFPTLVDLAGLPSLPQCPSDSHKVQVCTEGVSLSRIVDRNHHETDRHARKGNGSHRGDGSEGLELRIVESNAVLGHTGNFGRSARFSEDDQSDLSAVTLKNAATTHEIILDEAEEYMMKTTQERAIASNPFKPTGRFVTPLMSAEKVAAFSQYPRPGPTPSRNPDSDQPHTKDTTIMGYSVRTDRFRFTAWTKFDNVTYRPDWDHIIAEELYDHKIDPSEDHNVVGKRSYARRRETLYSMLRGGWRSALRWR